MFKDNFVNLSENKNLIMQNPMLQLNTFNNYKTSEYILNLFHLLKIPLKF
jgi:hypothetical protein